MKMFDHIKSYDIFAEVVNSHKLYQSCANSVLVDDYVKISGMKADVHTIIDAIVDLFDVDLFDDV